MEKIINRNDFYKIYKDYTFIDNIIIPPYIEMVEGVKMRYWVESDEETQSISIDILIDKDDEEEWFKIQMEDLLDLRKIPETASITFQTLVWAVDVLDTYSIIDRSLDHVLVDHTEVKFAIIDDLLDFYFVLELKIGSEYYTQSSAIPIKSLQKYLSFDEESYIKQISGV